MQPHVRSSGRTGWWGYPYHAVRPTGRFVAELRLRYARGDVGREDLLRALEDPDGPGTTRPGGTDTAPTAR